MRVTGSRVYSRPAPVPKMPPGLVELIEGLTREVLKNNPPDVYSFCADHMSKLLEIRDGPSPVKKLSLEQKILRAQEKVKNRAEQRWRRYQEELKEKNKTDDDCEKSDLSAVNESVTKTFVKPIVHQDQDLTHTSEIEISCEPGATVCLENSNNTKQHDSLEAHDKTENDAQNENVTLCAPNEENRKGCQEVPQQKDHDLQNVCTDTKILEISRDVSNANALQVGNKHLTEIEIKQVQENEPPKEDHNEQIVSDETVLQTPNKNPDFILAKDESSNKHNEVDGTAHETKNCDLDSKEAENNSENDCFKNEIAGSTELQIKSIKNNDDVNQSTECQIKSDEISVKSSDDIIVEHTESQIKSEKVSVKSDDDIITKNTELQIDSEEVSVKSDNDFIGENTKFQVKSHENSVKNNDKENDIKISEASQESSVNIPFIASEDVEPESNDRVDDENNKTLQKEVESSEMNKKELEKESLERKTENMSNSDVGSLPDLNESSNVESTNSLEQVVDLETVVNEAIENSKRKDSSSYDSIKEVNVLNEEESDASESSNNNQDKESYHVSENNSDDRRIHKADIKKIDLVSDIITECVPESEEHKRTVRDVQDATTSQGTNAVLHVQTATPEQHDHPEGHESTKISENSVEINQNDSANNMDLETAAVTIQKVFRTFLFKSRASTFEETVNDENALSDEDDKKNEIQFLPNNINKERRTLGISRMDTVLQTVNEEKSLSLSTDDSSLSSAATIIQAHVRGFLVRNKLHSGKTASSNSLVISNEPSSTSIDGDADHNKNKTILNIHIVPESGNYLSRDESMITSMDLSLDGSPPSSVNLHPHSFNTSERRKQLKREDAVQSVSPPSNNSGKLSEDVDSVKELTINDNDLNVHREEKVTMASLVTDNSRQETQGGSLEITPTTSLTTETVVEENKTKILSSPEHVTESEQKRKSLTKQSSDEMDVVTPFKQNSPRDAASNLLHSGEFHDVALPTKVSRADTPVASEFKNVLVYFLLWNKTTNGSC